LQLPACRLAASGAVTSPIFCCVATSSATAVSPPLATTREGAGAAASSSWSFAAGRKMASMISAPQSAAPMMTAAARNERFKRSLPRGSVLHADTRPPRGSCSVHVRGIGALIAEIRGCLAKNPASRTVSPGTGIPTADAAVGDRHCKQTFRKIYDQFTIETYEKTASKLRSVASGWGQTAVLLSKASGHSVSRMG